MKRWYRVWLIGLLAATMSPSLFAQVERAVGEAKGITWEISGCGSAMETTLLHLDGVANAASKTSKQMFVILYKPGATFQPKAIRDAVGEIGVEVVRFHIIARGTVNDEEGKQYFTAGKNRFLVVNSSILPTDCTLGIAATVDDSTSPPQIKIDDSKQLK